MLSTIANMLGKVGGFLVWVGMACGCILFWKLIIVEIILK